MKRKLAPLDISDAPELLRIAEEVERTQAALTLCRGGRALAVIVPAPPEPARPARPRRKAMSEEAALEIVRRTAGMFRQYRLTPPLTLQEEKEALAQAIADEVGESLRREAAGE